MNLATIKTQTLKTIKLRSMTSLAVEYVGYVVLALTAPPTRRAGHSLRVIR